MNRLAVTTMLVLAPFMALGYHSVAKVLFGSSDAARYIRDGGSIETRQLDFYTMTLIGAAFLGVLAALFVAIEVSRLLRHRVPIDSV